MPTETAVTTSSPHPPTSPVPRGRTGVGIPIGKLLDPLRWYFQWVRANPENASSLEQISRTFTLFVSDPTNLINSEACFALCKVHALSNNAIIATGAHRTTKTDILAFVLQAIQEVECLMELISRKYLGHRQTWNALLLLEAVKCTLKTCVHRQLFLIPWLWESLKTSLRRALRHLVTLGGNRRRRVRSSGNGGGGGSGKDSASITASFGAGGGGADVGAMAGLENGSSSLRGTVVGPNNVRLVIPRVVSDRRHEHRHVYSGSAAAHDDGAEYSNAHHHVFFPADDDVDAEEVEEGESIPFTWVDVLGMVLDVYLLLRPLVLVAVARHRFLQLPEQKAMSIAKLPPVMTRAQQAEVAAKTAEAAKATKAAAAAGQPAPPPPTLPDPLAALHKAISAAPQENLMGSWHGWGVMAGCDLLVAFLARVVRQKRVPVVYIHDGAESGESTEVVAPPRIAESSETGQDGGEAAEAAAVSSDVVDTTVAGRNAIGSFQDPPVVSRDRMRVQQALRTTLYGFLRDPFFTAVLKQFIYRHFVKGFVNRIPLVGPCVSFYVIHYLSMQHYSFLYTLGQ